MHKTIRILPLGFGMLTLAACGSSNTTTSTGTTGETGPAQIAPNGTHAQAR